MNPIYSLLESPHKWLILAGLAFGVALVGAMAMLAFVWPHWLAKAWFYVGLVATLYFLARAFLKWHGETEAPPVTPQSPGPRASS